MSRSRPRERGWPPDPEPLPAPVVDNHTHLESVLDFPVEDLDGARTLADHLARSAAAGVTRILPTGCDLDAAAWTDRLVRAGGPGGPAEATVALLGGVAIHPNEAVLHAGVHEVAPDGLEPSAAARHHIGLDDAIAAIAAAGLSCQTTGPSRFSITARIGLPAAP